MSTTATIDLLSYTNIATEQTGSAKSSTEHSDAFKNVFESVNKTYTKEGQASQTPHSTANADKKTNEGNNSKAISKTGETDNSVIKNTNEPTKNNETTTADKVTNENDTSNKNIENKTETQQNLEDKLKKINREIDELKNSPSVTDELKSKMNKLTKEQDELSSNLAKLKKAANTEISTELKPKTDINVSGNLDVKANTDTQISDTNAKEATDAQASVEDKVTTTSTRTDEVNVPAEKSVKTLPIAISSEVSNIANSLNTSIANSLPTETEQNQTAQTDINIDMVSNTKTLNDVSTIITIDLTSEQALNQANSQINNLKTQTQTQQALSNVKFEQPNDSAIAPQAQQAQQALPQATKTIAVEATAQVLVSEEALNISLTDTNTKSNTKIQTNNNVLTQDVLNKTNAQIVGVENSTSSDLNSNSNNLLNKQNAQEQSIKLELANNSSQNKQSAPEVVTVPTQNIDLAAMSDKTTQMTLGKTLEVTQTQVPKELTKTDIMAQINNQINTKSFQEEGMTKVNIILRPENLGKLNLELVTTKEGLTAQLTTSNAQVKEILDKSLDGLKESLSSQGVNVNSVSVKIEETQKQSSDMFSFNNGQEKQTNQESSNNANRQNQGEFSLEEEIENVISTTDINIDTEIGSENLASADSHSGKVDYKV